MTDVKCAASAGPDASHGAGAVADGPVMNPARDLCQRAQAYDGLMSAQILRGDGSGGARLVVPDEPAG